MKNTIGILLLLLLLLIGTCIYQKTYDIYALTHEDKNVTHIPKTTTPEKLLSKEAQVETQIVVASTEKPSMIESIKATVTSAISSDENKTISDTLKTNTLSEQITDKENISKQPSLNTEEKEKEVVGYLLTVLKERDVALSQRDEAETVLQALIKRVLEERQLVIETREKNALILQEELNARLKDRDKTAEDIYQKYTEEKGK